jgi:hypothetical protein
VQRVMKKYFADQNRLVLYYLPEATKQAKRVAPKAWRQGGQGRRSAATGNKEKGYRPEGPTENGAREVRK